MIFKRIIQFSLVDLTLTFFDLRFKYINVDVHGFIFLDRIIFDQAGLV